jgi:bla regulator protein BlaR1
MSTGLLLKTASLVFQMSCAGAMAAALVMLVRAVMGRALRPTLRLALWAVVAGRLIVPVVPHSLFSVQGLPSWLVGQIAGQIVGHGAALPATPADDQEPLGKNSLRLTQETAVASTSLSRAAPVAPADPAILLALVWASGAAVVLGRFLFANWRLGQRLRQGRPIDDPQIVTLLESCRASLNVRQKVRLLIAPDIAGPALAGVLRPVILLPTDSGWGQRYGLEPALSPEDLRHIFLHELAHVKRHDLAVDWVAMLLCCVHWFNPIVWLASICYRGDRELARDAMALRAAGAAARQGYGDTVLRLIQRTSQPAAPAIGMRHSPRFLKQRMRLIGTFSSQPPRTWARLTSAAIVCAVAWATLMDPQADQAAQPTAATAGDQAVVTQSYDVTDLVVKAVEPWHMEPMQDMSHPTKNPGWSLPPTLPEPAQLVREMVAPTSWAIAGRQISQSNGRLVVVQDRAVQAQVAAVLAEARSTRGLTVQVEANFLGMDKASFDGLSGKLQGMPNVMEVSGPVAGKVVSGPAAKDVLSAINALKLSQIAAPKLTLFSGERGWFAVSTSTAYTRDLKVVRDAGGVRYEPVSGVAQSGQQVDARVLVEPDRKAVALSLRITMSRLVRMSSVPFSGASYEHLHADKGGLPPPLIQVPTMEVTDFSSLVAVPDGQALIFGGQMNAQPPNAAPAATPSTASDDLAVERKRANSPRYFIVLVRCQVLLPTPAK